MFVFNVTVNNGISEEQMASLKDVLNAGKAEILAAVSAEAAQHAAKIDELAAKVTAGDLDADELAASLAEVASAVRGIVPDPPETPPTPPAGTGE